MRAADEFTDVGSAGYREQAKRVAERGGAKEYATSVEEEEAQRSVEQKRKWVLMLLAALTTGGAAGGALNLGMASSRVGAAPGIGRALFNTPGARMTAANASTRADRLSRLDYALDAIPAFRAAPAALPSLIPMIGALGAADYYDADIHPAVNWLWERPPPRPEFQGANWGRP
jgi:hypothetical protein